jgi:hypothetical protein
MVAGINGQGASAMFAGANKVCRGEAGSGSTYGDHPFGLTLNSNHHLILDSRRSRPTA